MEDMISKELLSEVLLCYISSHSVNNNIVEYTIIDCRKNMETYGDSENHEINIHELAHKCKEWALEQGYGLSSGIADHITKIRFCTATNDCFNSNKCFNQDTEVEAIFKSCQWIYENKAQ